MLESDHGPVDGLLREVWQSVRTIDSGQVADYIPELAKADPSTCGLSLATLDGAVYTAGDLVPFTIQSVSKPFVYALALADSGADAVLSKIGAEPTGDPFNTISLDDVSGRAFNPMVNAGAIVTATLVAGRTRAEQFDRILDGLSAFAGRALDVDEDVYASERDTGDRNRAIAYLMRSAG
jgi:glutaminase